VDLVTPAPSSVGTLPPRLRLRLLAVFILIGWALFLPWRLWLSAHHLGEPDWWLSNAVGVAHVLVSLAVVWRTQGEAGPGDDLTTIGLAYGAASAWFLELSVGHVPLADHGSRQAAWSALWIVLFPSAIPAPPRATLLAVGVAALGAPASLLIWGALGVPIDPVTVFAYSGSVVLAALLALLPATLMWRQQAELEAVKARVEQLGSYHLLRLIGKGGVGEVWEAQHALLARRAAVKIVQPDRLPTRPAERRLATERFHREAEVTARLQSPHTVAVFDYGEGPGGALFTVMEKIDGIDFRELVTEDGPQPAERVVALLRQCCESLAEAHGLGLVHRDVKPANLMLCVLAGTPDFVKVLDFGMVKLAPAEDDQDLTQGGAVGTPAYIAPEMVSGGPIDARADVYALGCVAFWLLTGQLVFPMRGKGAQMLAHAQDIPRVPSTVTAQPVPAALDALLLRCLAKDPGQRPATAADLGRELAGIAFVVPWSDERAAAWWAARRPDAPMPVRKDEATQPGMFAGRRR
jgi:tRNA A-37 threonylcarbamoyl transferase component Bud32